MKATLADAFSIVLITMNLILLGGYLQGAIWIVGLNDVVRIAPQTLLCFCCLMFVVVSRRARDGNLFSILVDVGMGSRIARVTLPFAILLPFLLFGGVSRLVSQGLLPGPYVYALAGASLSVFTGAVVIWMAAQINQLEHAMRELSLTDDLTHLNNRRGFYLLAQQVLREATRTGSGTTLFYFDLDGLKHANDTVGHEAGSVMIQSFASALMKNFRETDMIGRLGGDEFAVVTSRDFGKATEILARLEQSVSINDQLLGLMLPLNYSVGYAEINPPRKPTLDELIAQADAMMYQHETTKKHVAERPSPPADTV